MKQDKKKTYVIKSALSQQEMDKAEERFLEGRTPLLSLEEAFEQSKDVKFTKLT